MGKGDIIRMPWGDIDHIAKVLWLVEWRLQVEYFGTRFILPRGFYLKKKGYYVPIIDDTKNVLK